VLIGWYHWASSHFRRALLRFLFLDVAVRLDWTARPDRLRLERVAGADAASNEIERTPSAERLSDPQAQAAGDDSSQQPHADFPRDSNGSG